MNEFSRYRIISPAIFLIIIIALFWNFIPSGMVPERGGNLTTKFRAGDFAAYNIPQAEIIQNALLAERTFPFYNRFILSGTLFYSKSQSSVFSIRTIISLFLSSADAVKYSLLLHILISACGIFILMRAWKIRAEGAIISGIVFISSSYVCEHFYAGHENIISGLAFLPFIIYFYYHSLRKFSFAQIFLTSLFLSLQIYEGVDAIFLYTTIILLVFAVGAFVRKMCLKNLLSIFISGISIIILTLLFSAAKIYPSLTFIQISNRQGGIPLGESLLRLNEISQPGISIIALALAAFAIIFSLFQIFLKSKFVLPTDTNRYFPFAEMALIFCLGLLIGFGTFFYVLLWKYFPGFRFQRLPERAFILSLFAISIFAGAGFAFLFYSINEFSTKKINPRLLRITFLIIAILIPTERIVLRQTPPPAFFYPDSYTKNFPFKYLKSLINADGTHPRIHVIENTGIDWGIESITVPLRLENIVGYDNLWHSGYLPSIYSRSDEIPFFAAAKRSPLKFWGMLSTKYITSIEPLESPDLHLIKHFDFLSSEIPEIFKPLKKSYPRYIYENSMCLPRAYISKHAIAFIGDKFPAQDAIYRIMLDSNFVPKQTALIYSYKPEQSLINSSDAIFIFNTDALQAIAQTLQTSEKHRGDAPKIIAGFSPNDIEIGIIEAINLCKKWNVDASIKSSDTEICNAGVKIKSLTSSTSDILIDKNAVAKTGFLILSEKYSLFKEWQAFAYPNGDKNLLSSQLQIYRTNGVLSAISMSEIRAKSGESSNNSQPNISIVFKYTSKEFFTGVIISVFALLFSIAYALLKKFILSKQH